MKDGQVEPGVYNLNARPVTYTLSWRRNAGGLSVEIPAGRVLAVQSCGDEQVDGSSQALCAGLTINRAVF